MLNYEVDPAVLRPFVPRGVELDTWNDRHFVSVVGFLFLKTRVLGLPIPYHRDFEEINLRFLRPPPGGRRLASRRGLHQRDRAAMGDSDQPVSFTTKITVARRMRHRIESDNGTIAPNGSVEYSWHDFGAWLMSRKDRRRSAPARRRFGRRVHHRTLLGRRAA